MTDKKKKIVFSIILAEFLVVALVLFCTKHWILGIVCLFIAFIQWGNILNIGKQNKDTNKTLKIETPAIIPAETKTAVPAENKEAFTVQKEEAPALPDDKEDFVNNIVNSLDAAYKQKVEKINQYKIVYRDFDGKLTERFVDLCGFGDEGSLLLCFCHLRNEPRHFNVNRIEKLFTADGVQIYDPAEYFIGLYEENVKAEKEKVSSLKGDDLIEWVLKKLEVSNKYRIKEPVKVRIVYENYDGAISDRFIDICGFCYKRIQNEIDLYSFCNYQRDARLFRSDRIKRLFADDKEIENPDEYLMQLYYDNSEIGATDKILKNKADDINILVFLARASGVMKAEQRKAIAEYIKSFGENLSEETIDEALKNTDSKLKDFNNSLKNAKNWDEAYKRNFLKITEDVYNLKKAKDPVQKGVLDKIRKNLK